MVENNLCSGCHGCCTGVNFTVTREEKERDFSDTIEVDDLGVLIAKSALPTGSYSYSSYLHGSVIQKSRILMNEKCTHNDDEGNCMIYERRPADCRTFQRGGSRCNDIRNEQGLIPISNIETID